MSVPAPNVLSACAALHHTSYRAAVAGIINGLKTEFGESDQDVADRLGTSATTINNASNKRGDLNAVTLLRIGKEYGLARLGPVLALVGGKAAPIEAVCTSDLDLPVGAARGQLFLATALADHTISDAEILADTETWERRQHEDLLNMREALFAQVDKRPLSRPSQRTARPKAAGDQPPGRDRPARGCQPRRSDDPLWLLA